MAGIFSTILSKTSQSKLFVEKVNALGDYCYFYHGLSLVYLLTTLMINMVLHYRTGVIGAPDQHM